MNTTRHNIIATFLCAFLSLSLWGQSADAESYLNKASEFFTSNVDSAIFYANKGLELSKTNSSIRARLYLTLSNSFHRKGKLRKAIEYIELGDIVAAESEDLDIVAKVTFQKGNLHYDIGNYDAAVTFVDEASKAFVDYGDSASYAIALNLLAVIYTEMGEMGEALKVNQHAIDLNQMIDREHSLAIGLANRAEIYSELGDYESARMVLREAKHIFDSEGSEVEVDMTLLTLANTFLREERKDSALFYLDLAEELIQNPNHELYRSDYWLYRAKYFELNGNRALALNAYRSSYEVAKELGTRAKMRDALKGLYETSKELGNTSQALIYLEEYKEISDSLSKVSGEMALLAMELNKKLEHGQQMLEAEKTARSVRDHNSELKSQNQKFFLGMIVIGGILAFVLATLMVRRKQKEVVERRKQEAELKEELELRNKELVSSALQVLRKSEEMKQTITSLTEIQDRASDEDRPLLVAVIKKLRFELEHSTWEEFEVPFKKLHSSFYDRLIEKHPDLTRAEIKVCSLLKLDMDTKQMAAILHKTPSSIEVDRSRIRKKLGLTNTKTSLPRYINTNI